MKLSRRTQAMVLVGIFGALLVALWASVVNILPESKPTLRLSDNMGPGASDAWEILDQAHQLQGVKEARLILDGIETHEQYINAPDSGLVLEFTIEDPPGSLGYDLVDVCQRLYTAVFSQETLTVARVDCVYTFNGEWTRSSKYTFLPRFGFSNSLELHEEGERLDNWMGHSY